MTTKTRLHDLDVWHARCPECFGVGLHSDRCKREDAVAQRAILNNSEVAFSGAKAT